MDEATRLTTEIFISMGYRFDFVDRKWHLTKEDKNNLWFRMSKIFVYVHEFLARIKIELEDKWYGDIN